jgi:hypothetical protein
MRLLKILILCLALTVVMAVSWVIGTQIGSAVTHSAPPPPPGDAAAGGLAFLFVCAFNSFLIGFLLDSTRHYYGTKRRITLVLYIFMVQFLLPQMETFFFASDMGISDRQAVAILLTGFIVSLATVLPAAIVHDRILGAPHAEKLPPVAIPRAVKFLPVLGLLTVVGYPIIYLTFGYYIAWQSESLRIYYTSSPELASFPHQVGEALANGIYLFQILRGLIWIAITIPLVFLLKGNSFRQYLVVGILSALLPTSLLFIPNPYMPYDIAMTHFVETSTSNFLWGVMMVWGIKKALDT